MARQRSLRKLAEPLRQWHSRKQDRAPPWIDTPAEPHYHLRIAYKAGWHLEEFRSITAEGSVVPSESQIADRKRSLYATDTGE
ncbi:hypothetical protein LTR35_002213 [Friedmanniomyces endolithicus]|nr:hypothetical protein LTR35_002213 [Friedmanniomyces endolithicus]